MDIREIQLNEEQAWDGFVRAHPSATCFHETRFRHVLEKSYGLRSVYLAAFENGSIVGTLPLMKAPKFPLGTQLVTLPYLATAPSFLILPQFENPKLVTDNLLDAAKKMAQKLQVDRIEIREEAEGGHADSFSGFQVQDDFAIYRLSLAEGEENIWKAMDGKARNQVRKAEKEGLQWKIGGRELFEFFWDVYSKTMSRLGSPTHRRDLFLNLLDAYPTESFFGVVSLGDKPLSVLWLTLSGDRVLNPWAGSLREYSHLCANNLNYWKSISWAIQKNFKYFEFGRSPIGGPHAKFKLQWRAKEIRLKHYIQTLKGKESLGIQLDDPKVEVFQKIWTKLPISVANFLGHHLARRVP